MEARKVLNQLHQQLAIEGFNEIDVEIRSDDIIIVTRHDPSTHRMCCFFIYTAFTPAAIANPKDGGCYEIKGQVDEVVLEARLIVPENAHFVDEGDHINGLLSRCQISKHTKGVGSTLNFFAHRYDADRNTTYLTMTRAFVPGSVFIVMTAGYPHLRHNVARSIGDIDSILEFIPGSVKISRCEELHAYSYLLYSCCNEELDRSKGRRGCYALP